jgi:hypothetical protein
VHRQSTPRGLGLGGGAFVASIALPCRVRSGHLKYWQGQDKAEIIVGGNPIVPLDLAGQTTMHKHVLAITAGKDADGRHRRTAVAGPITRYLVIYVSRIEARRAVIAVLSARRKWPNKHLAPTTTEGFLSLEPLERAAALCMTAIAISPGQGWNSYIESHLRRGQEAA